MDANFNPNSASKVVNADGTPKVVYHGTNNAFFKDIDGKYYIVPISAGINENEETVYSIGNVQRRRHNTDAGSSSIGGALKNGAVPSRDIPRVSVKCKISDKRK